MDKTFICCECHQESKHYAISMCKKCYSNYYRSIPSNKEKHALYEKKRRMEGKTSYAEKKRSNTENRKSWRRKYNQIHYKNNREKLIAYQKEYRRKNREKVQEADAARKRLLRSMENGFSVRDWHNVLVACDWKCFYCHIELDNPERDHMIPITRGGKTTADNVVPTCHSCNCRKNNRTVEEYRSFLVSIGEVPLF